MPFNCKTVFLPPATKLRQGNVFTPVCDSVHRGRGGALSGRGYLSRVSLSRWNGVSVQGGLCLMRGVVSVRETHWRCTVTCGRYASWWNTFLSYLNSEANYIWFSFIMLDVSSVKDLETEKLNMLILPLYPLLNNLHLF